MTSFFVGLGAILVFFLVLYLLSFVYGLLFEYGTPILTTEDRLLGGVLIIYLLIALGILGYVVSCIGNLILNFL